ncbi:MAG: serine O-acetyltransferase EpsC [Myxococcota bacterium]
MPPRPRRYQELEEAIDAVVASYDTDDEINNLETAALPNKRAVIEAFDHIKPVLYMGFYATRELWRENLRHAVAEHVHAAYLLLVEQIERALGYGHWIGRSEDPEPCGSGEEVVLRLMRDLPRLRQLLNQDVLAAHEGDPAAASVEEIIFSYPSVEAITAYRVAHELCRMGVPMIPRIITEHAHGRTGIDINPGAQIGERFFIDHGTGVVIGETAVIGNNVKLYQGVTLGALSTERRRRGAKRHPTIEDDVTIYSGATILGGDTVIGRGSVVGGNVWLVESVPPGSTVFGRARSDTERRGQESHDRRSDGG